MFLNKKASFAALRSYHIDDTWAQTNEKHNDLPQWCIYMSIYAKKNILKGCVDPNRRAVVEVTNGMNPMDSFLKRLPRIFSVQAWMKNTTVRQGKHSKHIRELLWSQLTHVLMTYTVDYNVRHKIHLYKYIWERILKILFILVLSAISKTSYYLYSQSKIIYTGA